MAVDWASFKTKVTNWADRESSEVTYRFSVVIEDDYFILSSSHVQNNKKFKLKYTRKKYYETRENHEDNEILPALFQSLKEQYKRYLYITGGTKRSKIYHGR